MSFFATNKDSFKSADDLPFNDGDVIGFQCVDFFENAQKKSLKLRCRVMTGDHKGKDYNIFLSQDDNPANNKRLQQFFLTFWSKEEFETGSCKPAKLIGRKFVAKCSARMGKPKDGQQPKMFRNWGDFQDRGAGQVEGGSAPAQSQQTQTQAPTTPPPQAQSSGAELSF